MEASVSAHAKGVILVGSAAVCWSLGGLFFRAVALDAWTVCFWRSAFAALVLAGFACLARWQAGPARAGAGISHGLLVSAGIAVSMSTFLWALASTSVANVALIYATAPILTAVAAYFWLRERLDATTVVCALAVVIGAAVLLIPSATHSGIFGDLLAFVSTSALVFVALAIRTRPEASLLPYVCAANVLVAVVALPFASSLNVTGRDIALLAAFAFVQVALSFTLFTLGARILPARETALINALEGPLSPLWVWLAFGEMPLPLTILSGVIIMAAVIGHIVISSRRRSRRPALQKPVPSRRLLRRADRARSQSTFEGA